MTTISLNIARLRQIGYAMRNDAPPANVVAFHLGVQPNGGKAIKQRNPGNAVLNQATFPTRFD